MAIIFIKYFLILEYFIPFSWFSNRLWKVG